MSTPGPARLGFRALATLIGCDFMTLPSVRQPTSRCPIQLERTARIRDNLAIVGKRICRGLRALKINEAITGVAAVDQYALAEV